MNILLSYPRSGSTWLRYVFEYVSGKATVGQNADGSQGENTFDLPMVGEGEPVLIKRHAPADCNKLVFLVRDFKEAIPRHTGGYDLETLRKTDEYFYNVMFYENFPGLKKLVYYEDLVRDPLARAIGLCIFLGVPVKNGMEFVNNEEALREDCFNRYGMSKSRGEIGFHSSKIKGDWNGYVEQCKNFKTLRRYL